MEKIKGYLIGSKLTNSYSKEIYTNIDDSIDYKNKQIKNEEELSSFLSKKEYDYLNITAPYKRIVREYLDQESELVKRTGSCNLIVNEQGILKGFNTDYYGFKSLLQTNNIVVKGKKCLILGNGATSRTVEVVLKDMGASKIEFGCRTKHLNLDNEKYYDQVSKDAEIIVNTTPLGSKKTDIKLIKIKDFNNLESFIDVIYNPYRTPLMLDAIEEGKGAVNGYGMLFYQAKQAYEIATKKMYPTFLWLSLKRHLVLKHTNIVIVGMPTSGKSKMGKELEKMFNDKKSKSFIDTDSLCEEIMGMSIKKAFEKLGEEGFRQVEKTVVDILDKTESMIISTGGGMIIDDYNYRKLASKGFIVYLNKSKFDDFVDDGTRPLVKSSEDLNNLYLIRNPIYNKRADLILKSDISAKEFVEETINAIAGN